LILLAIIKKESNRNGNVKAFFILLY